jgi:hypothetical protein
MDTQLLREIIAGIKTFSKRKAKKLEILLNKYEAESNETRKRELKKLIHEYVYYYFGTFLDNDSRFIIENMGQTIAITQKSIERRANDSWAFGYAGAARVIVKDGKLTITNFIPRDYQKGFYLDTPEHYSKEDKERETLFYMTYLAELQDISRDMDRKQEVVSGAYQVRSPKIDRKLIEKMIDFLELARIKDNKKLHEKTRQYMK